MNVTGYSIGLVGFSGREKSMLEVFFDSSNNPGLSVAAPEKSASLLVNVETSADLKQFSNWYKSRSPCPVVAVVGGLEAPPDALALERPLEISNLKAVLKRVLEALRKSAAPVETTGERNRPRLRIAPEELKSLIAEAGVGTPKPAPKPEALSSIRDANKSRLVLRWSDAEQSMLLKRACGSLPDLDPELPGWNKRILFSLEGRFLDQVGKMVELARVQGVATKVTGIPGNFVYFPDRDLFSYDLDPDLLVQMAGSRFGLGELGCESTELKTPTDPIAKRDQLLWMLGLFTAAGRLPDHLDPAEKYRLVDAADLQRFMLMPQAEQIAKVWVSDDRSALDIVQLLKLPQRYVFSFMAAADAAGLLERR